MIPIIGVTGESKTGKTTIAVKIINELINRGYQVAAIKHTKRKLDTDPPGKDSRQYYDAGVGAVALASEGKITINMPTETPMPTPSLDVGDTQTRLRDGMVMVYVPAGRFEMGSDQEGPVHAVVLDAFWIDQTEITNARFAEFLNEQGNQVQDGVSTYPLKSLKSGSRAVRVQFELSPGNQGAATPVIDAYRITAKRTQ